MTIVGRLERLMRQTPSCREALGALASQDLPDAWIAAGLVRNAVWDERHGFPSSFPDDIDVIYFDPSDPAGDREAEVEARLRLLAPDLPWSAQPGPDASSQRTFAVPRAGWGLVSVPGLTLTRSGFALATSPAAWER